MELSVDATVAAVLELSAEVTERVPSTEADCRYNRICCDRTGS